MATEEHFPNRGPAQIGVTIFVTILSTAIAIWRLVVRFRINPRLGWSDYFIICAVPNAIVGHLFAIMSAYNGEGRPDADPFIKNIDQRTEALKWMFFHRCFNAYAMFFAKLSICTYLLALNFSKLYRITIWTSLIVILTTTGIVPIIAHWALCDPIRSRWDVRVKGHCLGGNQFKFASSLMQTISHVITDVVFAAAPILYLRRVQLSRYTRVGVQGVFLCSLLGTGISISKVVEFRRSYGHKNELYSSSISTTLSVCENSVAIIVACLPPLRRNFDDFLKRILPERVLTAMGASQPRSQNHNLPSYYTKGTRSKNGTVDGMQDDESELAILPDEEYVEDSRGKIIRTTKVVIKTESQEEFGSDGQKFPHHAM